MNDHRGDGVELRVRAPRLQVGSPAMHKDVRSGSGAMDVTSEDIGARMQDRLDGSRSMTTGDDERVGS